MSTAAVALEHVFVKFVPAADEMRIACSRCRRLLTLDESGEPCAPKAPEPSDGEAS